MSSKVIIVGAGVAGLSLAILLAMNKIECQVLESRTSFDGATGGVRISGDGVKVLDLIDVGSIGEKSKHIVLKFGDLTADFSCGVDGTSAIRVTRLALHEQLLERAAALGVVLTLGFKVQNVESTADGVSVTSDSGIKITGKRLVGADGVGSKVRQFLNPDQASTKSYAGYLGVGFTTENEEKLEMTVHHYVGHTVGVTSCGKVNRSSAKDSMFMWSHVHMSEKDAKAITREIVLELLENRSKSWSTELQQYFQMFKADSTAVLGFYPVYNGKPPLHWFGGYKNTVSLIGDAAHPYGPGGQGIAMALKDAQALCELIVNDQCNDQGLRDFQRIRERDARMHGEGAEKRNAPSNQATSQWSVFSQGVLMKSVELVTCGVLNI